MTDDGIRLALYQFIASACRMPSLAELSRLTRTQPVPLRDALARLQDRRMLLLESDGETIRMAPPFSGVETTHRVQVGNREYFANCAWDALGVCSALGTPGEVVSRDGASGGELRLSVTRHGPIEAPVLFHVAVPAAQWWNDLVYT
jgi:hypothetical protein